MFSVSDGTGYPASLARPLNDSGGLASSTETTKNTPSHSQIPLKSDVADPDGESPPQCHRHETSLASQSRQNSLSSLNVLSLLSRTSIVTFLGVLTMYLTYPLSREASHWENP